MRVSIGALCVSGGRVLLVRSKVLWSLPGGKPHAGESDLQALIRELSEELPHARFAIQNYFASAVGTTPSSNEPVQLRAFNAVCKGDITPGAELVESAWVAKQDLSNYELYSTTAEILSLAMQKGLV